MTYWVISDLNHDELQECAQLERVSIGCAADCLVCRKLSQPEDIGRLDSLPYTDLQFALITTNG